MGKGGVFHADAAKSTRSGGPQQPYVPSCRPFERDRVILHVGYGLNNTVQDVLVRWRRMAGDALGARHGPRRHRDAKRRHRETAAPKTRDLGRDAFVERVRAFADETRGEFFSSCA